MKDLLFRLQPETQSSFQAQIREKLVSAITGGHLKPDERLPSSRQLAKALGVSRNTVTLAYQGLMDDGFLLAKERSGYFVNPAMIEEKPQAVQRMSGTVLDWDDRLRIRPAEQSNITKPNDWLRFPYPFIYGQVDHTLFPIAEWRECSRVALGRKWLDAWTADQHAADDPMLVDQIRTRLLPRRGIMANENEILVTMGGQQALFLIAHLLVDRDTPVALENPGYRDVRNIFRLCSNSVLPVPIDDKGLVVERVPAAAQLIFATPSHQAPTTVTMPEARRLALLEHAARNDFLIVEDDYEFETNFVSAPLPALKSLDREGRVIYVGSLSKTLFPGLRLGFLVGPPGFIAQARALRRLMVRHPPSNNQRTTALFLSQGHHDALLARLRKVFSERWRLMHRTLADLTPHLRAMPSLGGSSVWVTGPDALDSRQLARDALARGVIIEPGDIYFARPDQPTHHFRLGFSSIQTDRIQPGLELLGELAETQLSAGGGLAARAPGAVSSVR